MDAHLPVGQAGSPASISGEEVESHIRACHPHWLFDLSFMVQTVRHEYNRQEGRNMTCYSEEKDNSDDRGDFSKSM